MGMIENLGEKAMEVIENRHAPLTPDLHELGALAAICARRASSQVEMGVRVARRVVNSTLAQMHHRAAEGGAYAPTSLKRKRRRSGDCDAPPLARQACRCFETKPNVKTLSRCDIACHFSSFVVIAFRRFASCKDSLRSSKRAKAHYYERRVSTGRGPMSSLDVKMWCL